MEFKSDQSFSINEILNKEKQQKESFIKDTSNLYKLLFNQYKNNNVDDENNNEIINKSLSMVFQLLKEMITPLYSLINDQMMPNIFELYQMTEDLRYYFALFNGDIKIKLKEITNNNNNNNNEIDENLILNLSLNQYNIDRKPINNEILLELEKESKDENKEDETKQEEQSQESQESQEENKLVSNSFFILFQIFTSIIYNLQSNCEKLLLQSINLSSEKNIKKEFYNYLIKRDIDYLKNLIGKFIIVLDNINNNNSKDDEKSFDSFSKLFENYKDNNNDDEELVNNNLLESFQIIFSNYIEINKIDVELILENLYN